MCNFWTHEDVRTWRTVVHTYSHPLICMGLAQTHPKCIWTLNSMLSCGVLITIFIVIEWEMIFLSECYLCTCLLYIITWHYSTCMFCYIDVTDDCSGKYNMHFLCEFETVHVCMCGCLSHHTIQYKILVWQNFAFHKNLVDNTLVNIFGILHSLFSWLKLDKKILANWLPPKFYIIWYIISWAINVYAWALAVTGNLFLVGTPKILTNSIKMVHL